MSCLHFQRLTSVLTGKAEPVEIVLVCPPLKDMAQITVCRAMLILKYMFSILTSQLLCS